MQGYYGELTAGEYQLYYLKDLFSRSRYDLVILRNRFIRLILSTLNCSPEQDSIQSRAVSIPSRRLTMLNHFSEDGSGAESWAGEPLPHISSHCKQALPGGQVSKSFVSSILNSFNSSDFRQQGCAWIIFSSSESQVYNSLFSGHSFPIAIHKGWTND